jgi:RNA-directed DNA polymerase
MTYEEVISCENLLEAWSEFVVGKRNRKDVQEFGRHLMTNLFSLHESLAKGTYRHGAYHAFIVADPKTRQIHKAPVVDRVLHHALYRKLYPYFDKLFIADSFSCRKNKGTHKALDRFTVFARKVSRNNQKTAWILKCDIRKFFASIDQEILLNILARNISDVRIVDLLAVILNSFSSGKQSTGLPLGNLTSQLFANVYMNEFDHFIKHRLRITYYLRYADDFALFSQDKQELVRFLKEMDIFLRSRLRLQLHPQKIFLRTFASGVDFLGWVHFPHNRVIRTVTKRRMIAAVKKKGEDPAALASYRGMLSHGNAFGIAQKLN